MPVDSLKISGLDRFLLSVVPGWGLRRLQARAAALSAVRHYDAAGGGRRTQNWQRKSTDANAANPRDISRLRNISRDLRRNNGWARRAIEVIGGNVVGWGIEAKASGTNAKRGNEVWRKWARSSSCDFDGRLNFAGLQRLVMDTVAESGEALVIRESGKASTGGLSVPVRIRVLEPDYLDTQRQGSDSSGNKIRDGIELNSAGERVAYYLFPEHPGSQWGGSGVSTRIPAERVCHVYNVERAGQRRGVPWLCAAIAKLQDFDEYDDARLMQMKIAACFGAFVTDMEGMGGAIGEEDPADDLIETLEPGLVEYLPPGKDIKFPSPPSAEGHGDYSETQLRRIAASVGVTYEDLTGDYSQVNFSSARMGRLAFWRNVEEWRWHILIPQFCDVVWQWVVGTHADMAGWSSTPEVEWSAPPMPMISPEKEGLANQRLIRSGVKTLYQVIRENGYDPDEHLQEIAEGNKRLDALGIVLDSDPRVTTSQGLAQADGAAEGGTSDDLPDD